MPNDSTPRRDGHDHLSYSDEEDTRYTGAPRRATRSNPYRQKLNTTGIPYEEEEENEDDARITNNSQDIIMLEPKSRPTQSHRPQHHQQHRTTSSHRSEDYNDFVASKKRNTKTTDQQVLRQPTQGRAPVRRPTDQIPAIRQTTQPRRPDHYTDSYADSYRDTRDTRPEKRREFHWLVPFGTTLILAIICYLLAYGAWTGGKNVYNDLTYGSTTRTTNLDAVVGDHDSATSPTHFVALNLHGTINIVEFPGGDVTHAKVYPGPHLLWSDADKAVVTMEVKDVNGDHKPDLVIHVYGDTDLLFHQTTASFVLLNNGSGFSPMQAYQ